MLKKVFDENKYWIAFTYSLMVAEFALFAFLPYILGLAIDSLLLGKYYHFWWYVAASFLALFLGFSRRRLDTRVFLTVWKNKSLEVIRELQNKELPESTIISRLGMVSTYGNFFEFTVPSTVSSILELTISLAMIWCVHSYLGITMAVLATIAIITSWIFSFYIQELDAEIQVLGEDMNAKIVERKTAESITEVESMAKKLIQRSDYDAASWRIIHLLWIFAEISCILVLVKTGQTAGTIMATMLYVAKLMQSSSYFTFFFNHLKQIELANYFLKKED